MASTCTIPTKTTAVTVCSYPQDKVCESNFEVKEMQMQPLKDGHILVKTEMISVDPYLRFKMGQDKYGGPFKIGEAACGWGVGKVIESKDAKFKVGDVIMSHQFPWATTACMEANTAMKVQSNLTSEEALGVCGMPAMTAFFGMEMSVADPKQGETIVVSGACGAVGNVVGQLAKMKGMKVVGIAGSDEKCKVMKEFGFDQVINYKESKDLTGDLKKACPNGIDIFWDNVGGEILEAATSMMNPKTGRIISCGSISQYNCKPSQAVGADAQQMGKQKGIKVHEVAVFNEKARWTEAIDKLAQMYKSGKLKKKTTVYKGIQSVPKAFVDLFGGKNIGKMLVDVTA